jgi:predicted Zn-dependent protease
MQLTGIARAVPALPRRTALIPALIDLMANYYQLDNPDQLAAIARTMLAAIPDDLVGLQFLGLALYQMGRVADAKEIFRNVEIRTEEPLQECLPSTGEPAAVTAYREATRPGSRLAAGWRRLAKVMAELGFRQAAVRAAHAWRAARGGQPLTCRRRAARQTKKARSTTGPLPLRAKGVSPR